MATSLFVGDLEENVTDSQLFNHFNQIGHVISIFLCKDIKHCRSLGYGYVNYSNPKDASKALHELNFTQLNGKSIRIMYSNRDPTLRMTGVANVFVKNLDKSIDNKALYDIFTAFGLILSSRVATDSDGHSKGYGFVQFDKQEDAQSAVETLNGVVLYNKKIYVGPFCRKEEREAAISKSKMNNVFVKNLSETTTENDLHRIFGEFGEITSAVVMKDENGKSKCFGFVSFDNADGVARAIQALNGKIFDNKRWYVGKAQKKSERQSALKLRYDENILEPERKFEEGANLYVKNLDDSIDDYNLEQLFSPFGTVTSCRVLCDPNGISKGAGFVAFSTPEEATRAMLGLNGTIVISKPLYVAPAERKEDRKAKLEAHFSQMKIAPMAPPFSSPPRMPIRPVSSPCMPMHPPPPMHPPALPGLGQQLFYCQAPAPPPVLPPPQAQFGYQPQLLPGLRPGGGMRPNFFMPMAHQGQLGHQFPIGSRGGAFPHTQQYHFPLMQQQMYPKRHDMGGMFGMPPRDASPTQTEISYKILLSALKHCQPEQRIMLIGESLYPLVEKLAPDVAAKITGMLLEMDEKDILTLIESPEALKEKVQEARQVLKEAFGQRQTDNAADQVALSTSNDNQAPI